MKMTKEEFLYRKSLEHSLSQITFDRASGITYPFERLFYPLEIGEGRNAFQTYADQIKNAHWLKEHFSDSDLEGRERQRDLDRMIESYFEKYIISNSPPHIFPEKGGSDKNPMDSLSTNSLLYVESRFDPARLVISDPDCPSRIILIASAGHGKTTLLRRIALYYSHPWSKEADHINLGRKYSLTGDFIPCLIELRGITGPAFSLVEVIKDSILSVMAKNGYPHQSRPGISEEEVTSWLHQSLDRMLLLVDGLDECSEKMRMTFLSALDEHLKKHPNAPIIMTSRPAGLSHPKILSLLDKMSFRGRSIIPLTGEDAKKYSYYWIDLTQPPEYRDSLQSTMDNILSQEKYEYLREFMRTPLELIFMLNQVANDSLSLNRYQLFRDTLWEYFTGHVKSHEKKRSVYEDTMIVLSFIAYQMQIRDLMVISLSTFKETWEDFRSLSFHTDIIKNGDLENFRDFLHSLTNHLGILEKEEKDSGVYYTFPIRSYQEFLTAHACCHLRLNKEMIKPDPLGILLPHIDDSSWTNIINFALLDLEENHQAEFDTLLYQVFHEVKNVNRLRQVIEADLSLTRDHALYLTKSVFSSPVMVTDQKDLLVACMKARSAYAFVLALRTSFEADPSGDGFLEAMALASVLWECDRGRSPTAKALSCLLSDNPGQERLGAVMISWLSRALMDELSEAYKDRIKNDFLVTDEMVTALDRQARKGEISSITALTDIWLSKVKGGEAVEALLDNELANQVISKLESYPFVIRRLCLLGRKRFDRPEYQQVLQWILTLGSIPYRKATFDLTNHGRKDLFLSSLIQATYYRSKHDLCFDHIALATACLYYCWDLDDYMHEWVFHLCHFRPSGHLRKGSLSTREINHFGLIQHQWEGKAKEYRRGLKRVQKSGQDM